ncbi:30S ribosomal protein S17 [Candidatus Saccharibacteria bacterium]|nr:30S ribosomal protein S17 [Candidatus Saccharibacteria bacterium]
MAHTLIGIVTSDKRDKTITVADARRETHPLYRKQYTKTRKYTAHDEKNEAHKGDKVEIESCRPISKTKSYKLVKVLERAHGTVELKEGVTAVVEEKKIGADAEVAEARKAEKAKADMVEADGGEV